MATEGNAPDPEQLAALKQELDKCQQQLDMAELMLREQSEELSEANQKLRDTSDEVMLLRRQSLESETRERVALADADAAELVRGIVETVPDAIITIDTSGSISMLNPAAEQMFGYSARELAGHNISELMPEPFRSEHDGYLQRYLETGEARIIGTGREVVALRRDGTEFPVDLAVGRFNTGNELMFAGVIRDISERKAAERELALTQQQLAQSEKLASLGGLVAGVAHEINTPVGIGVTAASTLRERASALHEAFSGGQLRKSEFEEFLRVASESSDLILQNLDRASHLVQSFKQLAVIGTGGDHRTFDLNQQLTETASMLRGQLAEKKVSLTLHCEPEIAMQSYPGELREVLHELIDNAAIHAFPDVTSDGTVTIDAARGGHGVIIRLRDNGRGVPADNMGKLFEPFFTTRRGQGGGGLGLHVVYNRVTGSLGGNIRAQAAEPGTEFVIDLPLEFTQV